MTPGSRSTRCPLSAALVATFAAVLLSSPAPATGQGARPGAPAVDLASLLPRLAESDQAVSERMKRLGCTMTTRVEVLDRKGKPEKVEETVERVRSMGSQGDSELLRMTVDGKDRTAEERAKREKAKAEAEKAKAGGMSEPKKSKEEKSESVSVGASSPFDAELQKKYRFTIAGKDPSGPDRWRIRFEPKGEASEELQKGEAIVDVASGIVLRVAQSPSKNPRFVDRLETVMEFDPAGPGGAVLKSLTVDGEGGILFIRKRFHVATSFSDWSPARENPPAK